MAEVTRRLHELSAADARQVVAANVMQEGVVILHDARTQGLPQADENSVLPGKATQAQKNTFTEYGNMFKNTFQSVANFAATFFTVLTGFLPALAVVAVKTLLENRATNALDSDNAKDVSTLADIVKAGPRLSYADSIDVLALENNQENPLPGLASQTRRDLGATGSSHRADTDYVNTLNAFTSRLVDNMPNMADARIVLETAKTAITAAVGGAQSTAQVHLDLQSLFLLKAATRKVAEHQGGVNNIQDVVTVVRQTASELGVQNVDLRETVAHVTARFLNGTNGLDTAFNALTTNVTTATQALKARLSVGTITAAFIAEHRANVERSSTLATEIQTLTTSVKTNSTIVATANRRAREELARSPGDTANPILAAQRQQARLAAILAEVPGYEAAVTALEAELPALNEKKAEAQALHATLNRTQSDPEGAFKVFHAAAVRKVVMDASDEGILEMTGVSKVPAYLGEAVAAEVLSLQTTLFYAQGGERTLNRNMPNFSGSEAGIALIETLRAESNAADALRAPLAGELRSSTYRAGFALDRANGTLTAARFHVNHGTDGGVSYDADRVAAHDPMTAAEYTAGQPTQAMRDEAAAALAGQPAPVAAPAPAAAPVAAAVVPGSSASVGGEVRNRAPVGPLPSSPSVAGSSASEESLITTHYMSAHTRFGGPRIANHNPRFDAHVAAQHHDGRSSIFDDADASSYTGSAVSSVAPGTPVAPVAHASMMQAPRLGYGRGRPASVASWETSSASSSSSSSVGRQEQPLPSEVRRVARAAAERRARGRAYTQIWG
ncbi:MAG: hypothetical protein SP1CHLAM54_06210 [Chlamydiia bacterium]|nr:hypothetical protein [Chlamydiia bacterium]MCH9615531.1 hypothetical protein [Chlamydiia bacterium]MCH9629186.1 hypothetical protein [Chlamydiia bacterium]